MGVFFTKGLAQTGPKYSFFYSQATTKSGTSACGRWQTGANMMNIYLKKLILERQNLLYLLKNTVYGYDLFSKDIPFQVRLHAPASLGALRQKSSVAPKT